MERNKKRPNDLNIVVDESNMVEDPTFLQRFRNSIYAIFMGAIFAQVMFFAFGMGSLVIWYDNLIFISYLVVCSIMGWVAGERFIDYLSKKSDDWWDIWGHFRQK